LADCQEKVVSAPSGKRQADGAAHQDFAVAADQLHVNVSMMIGIENA
jgi:hypothetical protein